MKAAAAIFGLACLFLGACGDSGVPAGADLAVADVSSALDADAAAEAMPDPGPEAAVDAATWDDLEFIADPGLDPADDPGKDPALDPGPDLADDTAPDLPGPPDLSPEVDACPASCGGKQCGTDGCGGTCGACNAGQTCVAGRCGTVPDSMTIPHALAQSVDDVGWKALVNVHVDANHHEIPGAVREHATLPDYQNLVDIGKAAGTRLMTAWILQDFDTSITICQQDKYNADGTLMVPGASPMQAPLAQQVMSLIGASAAWVELGIHGVSHEHNLLVPDADLASYDPAKLQKDPKRGWYYQATAEFAHLWKASDPAFLQDPAGASGHVSAAHPGWGWQNGQNHLDCWDELYRQYFPAGVHSFPRSFVPPGHGFYFNQDGPAVTDQTTADLVRARGVKYVNADQRISFTKDQISAMGDDPILHGVSFLHRTSGTDWDWANEVPWYGSYNSYDFPSYPPDTEGHIEAHFPNVWDDHDAADNVLAKTAVAKWTQYLLGVNDAPDRFLAKNTAQNHSQYLYRHHATLHREGDAFVIDTTGMPAAAMAQDVASNLLGALVLKVPLAGVHVTAATAGGGATVVATWEDDFGYGYLVVANPGRPMGRLDPGVYSLQVILGDPPMDGCVDLGKATFNVFALAPSAEGGSAVVEMYGTQDVVIRTGTCPASVVSGNPALVVNSFTCDAATHRLTASLTALDVQGVVGVLTFP